MGASVSVIARCPIGCHWIGADPGGGITDADVVALIEGRADDRIRPNAGSSLTGVGLGTEVAVIAWGPVGHVWIRAESSRGVAHTSLMALVERGADDWIRPITDSGLTGIGERAEVAVVA